MTSNLPARERDLGFTAFAFAAGLAPRVYVALAWAREPVWDGHYYDFGAKRIAAGLGYSADELVRGSLQWNPWCHYPVGYSGFLAVVYSIFGSGPSVAPLANAVVGALLAAVVHRLARRALSPTRARVAALLAALWPGLVVYAALVMTEPLAALGLCTAGWLAAREAERGRAIRGAVLGGVALGLTALVRPPSLLCLPALAFFAWPNAGTHPPRARLWRPALALTIATLAAAAPIAPWTLRNCRVMDGCALISTNAGWNLAIGAKPGATGRFDTLRAGDGCSIVTGQVHQDRCWLVQGIQWIKSDPVRWLSLIPMKLSQTFDHESFPMGYLGEADRSSWPERRKALGRGILSTLHRSLLALAALALIAIPTRRGKHAVSGAVSSLAAAMLVAFLAARGFMVGENEFWPLAAVIPILALVPFPGAAPQTPALRYLAWAVLTIVITHAVFFGEDRYHVVATPALLVLAAGLGRSPRAQT